MIPSCIRPLGRAKCRNELEGEAGSGDGVMALMFLKTGLAATTQKKSTPVRVGVDWDFSNLQTNPSTGSRGVRDDDGDNGVWLT